MTDNDILNFRNQPVGLPLSSTFTDTESSYVTPLTFQTDLFAQHAKSSSLIFSIIQHHHEVLNFEYFQFP